MSNQSTPSDDFEQLKKFSLKHCMCCMSKVELRVLNCDYSTCPMWAVRSIFMPEGFGKPVPKEDPMFEFDEPTKKKKK